MNILGFVLMPFAIFAASVLAAVFVFAAGFVAVIIILTIWRLLYSLIRPIYEKWYDWVSDALG